jgi:drug/metabolite transporter (DMT)-like permease
MPRRWLDAAAQAAISFNTRFALPAIVRFPSTDRSETVSDRMLGYLYLTLATWLVGSTVVASKVAAGGVPPFTATALRFALALPCFLAMMRASHQALPRLHRRDRAILLVQAVAGTVGYTALLIAGLRTTSSTDASVILGTLPVVSAVVAVLVLGERPGLSDAAAVGLAAAGILVLSWQPADGTRSFAGDALVFGAVGCEALFILLNKRLDTPLSPLVLSTLVSAIGLLVSLPAAIAERPWATSIDAAALLAVAYYALLPTVGGFLLWYAGTARVSGTEAALFTSLAPVAALLLTSLLLDEPVGWRQIAGIACVLAAVLSLALVQQRRRANALNP